MGFRIATSIGGQVTGERAHIRIFDDAHKPEEALSDQVRESTIEWVKSTWSTRESDPRTSAEIGIGQRVHQHDVMGYLLEEVGGYEYLMLPMRYESDRKCTTSIGFTDPREVEGELLCPERFDEEAVDNLEKRLTFHASGQLQQRPSGLEGAIFKQHFWRFWYRGNEPDPWQVRMKDGSFISCRQMHIPDEWDRQAQSWDMTFKDTKGSDYAVGQVWGLKGSEAFLLDQVRAHMDFPAACDAVIKLAWKWPKAGAKWIEDAANGPAVIQSLRKQVPGLIPLKPSGSKEARAHAVTPFVVAGNVYLPHPRQCEWTKDLLGELTQFPRSKYDDQTDALTQALSNLLLLGIQISSRACRSNTGGARFVGAAAKIVQGRW